MKIQLSVPDATANARVQEECLRLLTLSDIEVLPDRWEAMSKATRTAWANYRAALRVMYKACIDPHNPKYPSRPDGKVV